MKINNPISFHQKPLLVNNIIEFELYNIKLQQLGFIFGFDDWRLDYPFYLYCYSNRKVLWSYKLLKHDYNSK